MKKTIIFSCAILLLTLSPIIMTTTFANAAAATSYPIGTGGAEIPKPTFLPETINYTTTAISNYIYYLVGAMVTLSAALAVFFIYWGGSTYVTSMGSDENLGKAKKTIMWAILGLLLVIISYQIVVTIITMIFKTPV
ncbi:hypothetical protein HZA41_02590 [Candidatus Peregrinibacteria bacterium]|nr:hypothetical protein [Candidatus Peregrinibacteria bacterium]